jgi:hypothetical protein
MRTIIEALTLKAVDRALLSDERRRSSALAMTGGNEKYLKTLTDELGERRARDGGSTHRRVGESLAPESRR